MIISQKQKSLLLESLSSPVENWIKDHYFEVEIGCGKGSFLIERAQQCPQHRFLGIDWSWKWMKIGIDSCIKRDLKNIIYDKAEAELFFSAHIPAESVNICHIYFPDPWPKKKHHKRRLLTPSFLDLVHTKLKARGILHISTDFLDYYDTIQENIYQSQSTWKSVKHNNRRQLFQNCESNYEKKYRKEGRRLSFIELHKV